MCGIIGCAMEEGSATEVLLGALKRLEYRGYDSAGIAVVNGRSIETIRQVGRIEALEEALRGREPTGTCGIGHTRWATHGRPSELNAHPHRDASGSLVVAHNGIIENYQELRARLQAGGVTFTSETDSEVIAHLVSQNYEGDLVGAVRLAVRELEGSYAISITHRNEPGLVVGALQESPLVVGLGQGANYLASDAAALLPLTRNMVYLEDGDLVAVTAGGVRVLDSGGKEVKRPPVTVTWSAEQAEKGGYDHFMLKEIHEQPATVSDCLLGRFADDDREVVLDQLGLDDEELRRLDRIAIVACGTSWHAGHVGKFYLEELARLPVEVDYASEFTYREPALGPHSLVVAISQSGETADTRAAMKRGREEFGARTLTVCNVAGSSMARGADGLILTHAGPEIGVASTKAFMGQLVSLLLLALRLGQARGSLAPGRVQEVARGLRRLPHALETVLKRGPVVRDLARDYVEARDFLYIGRGVNYPIALEGALKLKEISYIHAEGYPAGEMKHGPIALIDEGMPILAVATKGRTYRTISANVAEARSRGGHVLALVNDGDEALSSTADRLIRVPEVPEMLSPMVNIVPLQLLAYWIARLRGTDVDKPRNLAKTVTVQ